MSIAEKIRELHAWLPADVEVVAVSKFHPVEQLMEAYNAGQRIFGESRQQELLAKIPQMPADVRWHFIGHLQTNKVRSLVGRVAMIESVDTQHLLDLIDAESVKAGVVSRVLLQVHVAQEETKFGFYPEEIYQYMSERRFEALKATHLCGIMGMATNTDDTERVRLDFQAIAECKRRCLEIAPDLRGFDILSMGMSDDFKIAIEEGSTLVRIGTAIFGPRNY